MSSKNVYRSRRNVHGEVYRLMIKTHNQTGLKYLCQSSRIDYINYTGSGSYWKKHLSKHGPDFSTIVLFETTNKDEIKQQGIYYSNKFNVVNSEEWANLVPEQGDGGYTANLQSYKDGMANRNYKGSNNPNYGKVGALSPKYGKKYGPKPNISKGTKEAWNDQNRRLKASEKSSGSGNNQAKKCIVDGIKFDCLKSAALYFGYENAAKRHDYSVLRKKHKVEII